MTIYYIHSYGKNSGVGYIWDNAYTNLHDAVEAVRKAGCTGSGEVWESDTMLCRIKPLNLK